MTLLLLGGTSDARHLADKLHNQGITLIYSVAGLVRMPDVSCEIITGGFRQFGGLLKYIQQQNISAILDVTHPYAQTMSSTAVTAAKQSNIPCWRFHRPPWQVQEGDDWHLFKDWGQLLPALTAKKSVFFTSGQLEQSVLDNLTTQHVAGQKYLLRTAVKPKVKLLESMQWLKAIGPFSQQNELALMQQYQVDVLVSKNSGGQATEAKLHAARQLNIPVYMLQRPNLPDADNIFFTTEACEQFVVNTLSR